VSDPYTAKAREVIASLLNPEPHPFQKEWSDAHSMSMETMIERLASALREAVEAEREAWKRLFIWEDGKPYYRTDGGIKQEIPPKIERAIRARGKA